MKLTPQQTEELMQVLSEYYEKESNWEINEVVSFIFGIRLAQELFNKRINLDNSWMPFPEEEVLTAVSKIEDIVRAKN